MKLAICVCIVGLLTISFANAIESTASDDFLNEALDAFEQHFDGDTNKTAEKTQDVNKDKNSSSNKRGTTANSGLFDAIETTLGQATDVLDELWEKFKKGMYSLIDTVEGTINATTTATTTFKLQQSVATTLHPTTTHRPTTTTILSSSQPKTTTEKPSTTLLP